MKFRVTKGVFFKLSFLGIFISLNINAQIKITTPVERSVYQRGVDGRSKISVAGSYSQIVDKIEVRAVSVIPGQGIDTDWAVLQNNPTGGVFVGTITLLGGWYSLQVRASYKNAVVGSDVIPRFGVGEVFIIAGQSNGQGLRGTSTIGATDDRVNFISNYDNTPNSLNDPPAPAFAQLTSNSNMAPRGQTSWCWGILGDSLAKRLNVPVLFINTAWEGTSIGNWQESSKGLPTYNAYGGFPYSQGMPFANLLLSINHFTHQLGTRAILWIQGEADNLPLRTSRAVYANRLASLIEQADISSSKRIIWVISRTSRTADDQGRSVTSQSVIDAQSEIAENKFYPVYPGPFTDQIAENTRPDGTHFSTPILPNFQGLLDLGNAWFRTFTESNFFSQITPVLPAEIPQITAECDASNNGITLTLPTGYASYSWNNSSSTSRTITVTSPGSYRATLKDAKGNAVLTPVVDITQGVRPSRPLILPSGELQACADTPIELSASGGVHQYSWYKDGSVTAAGEGAKFTASSSGRYTVMARNVFGCTSELSTQVSVTVREPVPTPTVATSGPFSVKATLGDESQAQGFEWRKNGDPIAAGGSIVKVTGVTSGETVSFDVRARRQYILAGNTLTCYSPYSAAFEYKAKDGDDVVVFPNPSRGGEEINIESRESLLNVNVAVYNSAGNLMYTRQFANFDERVSLSQLHLPAGIYLIKVSGDGVDLTKRHVVL